jgi:carboxylesterase type B
MNIRACSTMSDPKMGAGFALVSREILLYLDKDTGAVLKTWKNPYTGETVSVQQVANDPVNWEMYETGRDGKPAKWEGQVYADQWSYRSTFPLWYSNPLGGNFQAEVSGTYHATELFNFFGRKSELFDRKTTSATAHVARARMSDWLPWMKMIGRAGVF